MLGRKAGLTGETQAEADQGKGVIPRLPGSPVWRRTLQKAGSFRLSVRPQESQSQRGLGLGDRPLCPVAPLSWPSTLGQPGRG